MGLILFLLKASRRVVLLATLIGVISGVASVALIGLIHRVLREPDSAASINMWLFIGLCVVILISRIISQSLLTRLSQHSVSELIKHLCERIMDAPLRQIEQLGAGRLYATLTTDVIAVAHALNALPTVFVSVIIMLSGILYLGWLSPIAFVPTLVFLCIGVLSYRMVSRRAHVYLQRGREYLDQLMHHIDTLISGVKELKVHAGRRRAFMVELLAPADAKVREQQIAGFSIQNTAATLGRLLFFVAIGLLIFARPASFPLSHATLVAYVLVILYLTAPLERIMAWLPLMSRARVALRKIGELRLTLEHGEGLNAAALVPQWQRLELRGVCYSYGGKSDAHPFELGPIDLMLSPGELVFIVGGNGSGKTTLAKLLAGLYLPDSGQLLLDGVPVNDENRAVFRQLFSLVFADTPVFDGLIGLNRDRVEQHAQRYLETLEIDDKVRIREGMFSTVDLSRGQRKRLALLTAYLEDRPIYVLDEWAADQDPVFRRVFYQMLLPELKAQGKTAIVISHDDRYFDIADRIVTLDEGRIRDNVTTGRDSPTISKLTAEETLS
ncbi:MAG: cyclic peptide export ABC transporter [Gammaproteobacteria bacterium]|nr:cyclic peptide export ABC transporter [Gammaproteobacteria bacterium]